MVPVKFKLGRFLYLSNVSILLPSSALQTPLLMLAHVAHSNVAVNSLRALPHSERLRFWRPLVIQDVGDPLAGAIGWPEYQHAQLSPVKPSTEPSHVLI